MKAATLDVRAWNLSIGLAAVVACGPKVDVSEDNDDTEGADDGDACETGCFDEGDDDDDDDDDDGPLDEGGDHDSGFYDDYGPDDDDDDSYNDTYYEEDFSPYDCYSDDDCGTGGFCDDDNMCVFPPALEACGRELSTTVVDLGGAEAVDGALVVAFVDVDGNAAQDLLIATAVPDETVLVLGGGAPSTIPAPFPAGVRAVASGDFSGDGAADLAVSTLNSTVEVWLGNGVDGYGPGPAFQLDDPAPRLAAVQWDDDGFLDLAVLIEGSAPVVFLGDGMGNFTDVVTDPFAALESQHVAVGDFGGDAPQDLALAQTDSLTLTYLAGGDPDAVAYVSPNSPTGVFASALEGLDPVHVTSPIQDGTLLHTVFDGSTLLQASTAESTLSGLGDVDGDGDDDIVLIGDGEITIVEAEPLDDFGQGFACEIQAPWPPGITALTLGDIDGDGDDDIVYAHPEGVTAVTLD